MEVLDQFKQQAAQVVSADELGDLFSGAIKTLGYGGFDAFSVKPGTGIQP